MHVLTGPDHLSALATLSAAVSERRQAFFLGVRWGIGHSTGLLLVGVILIVQDAVTYHKNNNEGDDDDSSQSTTTTTIEVPDSISHLFESLVGVFMLLLGCYGIRQANERKHHIEGQELLPTIEEGDDAYATRDDPIMIETTNEDPVERRHHQHPQSNDYNPQRNEEDMMLEVDDDQKMDQDYNSLEHTHSPLELEIHDSLAPHETLHPHVHDHHHHPFHGWNDRTTISAKSMAILAGIIHGLAGPGGVLGVIPAVQLHDWKLATVYLASFCVSSTLTMGCFATFYGTVSTWLVAGREEGEGDRIGSTRRNYHRLEYPMQLFSASLSILVGITWLVLLYFGKLEDVFP